MQDNGIVLFCHCEVHLCIWFWHNTLCKQQRMLWFGAASVCSDNINLLPALWNQTSCLCHGYFQLIAKQATLFLKTLEGNRKAAVEGAFFSFFSIFSTLLCYVAHLHWGDWASRAWKKRKILGRKMNKNNNHCELLQLTLFPLVRQYFVVSPPFVFLCHHNALEETKRSWHRIPSHVYIQPFAEQGPRLTSSLSSQKSDFASVKAQSCFSPSFHSFTSSFLPSALLSTSGSFANVRHRSESGWSNSACVWVGACLREWRH